MRMNHVIETFVARNRTFAATRFDPSLKMLPKAKTVVIGCIDPRVDPALLLGLEPAETAVLRNIGGRVTPSLLLELDLLRGVARAGGGDVAAGWNLVVLHHTDCGITRLDGLPDELGRFFEVPPTRLPELHVHDPRASVKHDVEALRRHPGLSDEVEITGLVYDVTTGKVELGVTIRG